MSLPLSPAQMASWRRRELFAPNDPYTENLGFAFRTPIDPERLIQSFVLLVANNPILHTVFARDESGIRQRLELAPESELVERHSVAQLAPNERICAADEIIDEFYRKLVDPFVGPHAQMCLVDLGDGEFRGGLRASRLAMNRPRWLAFAKQFQEIYIGKKPESTGYYTEAQIAEQWRNFDERKAAAETFWAQRLPADMPVLALPMKSLGVGARYTAQRGGYASIEIDQAATRRLREQAQKLGVSIPSFVHATLVALLNRYGDNSAIPVVRHFNQDWINANVGGLARINLLPVLVQVSRDDAFSDVVKQVLADYQTLDEWRDIPFPLLDLPHRVSIEDGLDPAFQVGLRYWDTSEQPIGAPAPGRGQPDSYWPVRLFRPPTDLELSITDHGTDMVMGLHYCSDLFDPQVIDDVAGHFRRLLIAFVNDPELAIGEPGILGRHERQRLLVEWNQTARQYPVEATLMDLLRDSFEKHSDRIALRDNGNSYTYAQLEAGAAAYAHELLSNGVLVGDRVALRLERSRHMIEAIIGVLMVGGVYVPVETDVPAARVEDLLDISGAVCAIADEPSVFPLNFPVILTGSQPAHRKPPPLIRYGPENLLYVLFTSGSTGRPKAAQLRHSGIVNLLQWIVDANGITAADNVVLKSPYAHDISVPEMYLPLILGGCMVIAQPDGHRDPKYLVELVKQENVSVIHFVPTMLAEFVRVADALRPVELKHIFVGGEALTKELATQVLSFPGWQLHNLYGTTECSDYSTAWDVDLSDEAVICPIGRPIYNVRLYILGKHNDPKPVGVPGELCVAGISVGAGYLGSPEVTAKTFVPNPFEPGTLMYRTGDICRYRPDGVIEYVRRGDGEVKIRGHRIDLTEIESRVAEHPNVGLAAILLREDTPGIRQLVAYAEQLAPVTPTQLQQWCQQTLAEYMVPSAFVVMDSLPQTMSGKIDRKQLPAPAVVDRENVEATGELQTLIRDVWCEVFNLPSIGVTDDFYEIGGDSVLAIRIATAMQQRGYEITVRDVFAEPTIAGLAGLIESDTDLSATTQNDVALWQSRVDSAVREAAPSSERPRQRHLPNRTVILTGATGYLGRNLLAQLLERTNAKVVCLLRGRSDRVSESGHPTEVRERLYQALIRAQPDLNVQAHRLAAVESDLGAPALGLDTKAWDRLVGEADSIVHVGAWVHHLHPFSRLAVSNVAATAQLCRMSAEAGGVPLRFVSTLPAVLYESAGVLAVVEDVPTPPPDAGGYVESKWVAEQLVAALRKQGRPVQTIRPPWLYASSIDGAYNPDDALTRLLLGCIQVGAVPDVASVQPMVCIDTAVEAILADDVFADPANGSAFLPFVNVSTEVIFDHLRGLGLPLQTLPVEQWREKIAQDNPARAVLSDFQLAVGEDPTTASLECPEVSPTVGNFGPESVGKILQATTRLVDRIR